MFKALTGLALAIPALSISTENSADGFCHGITTTSGSVFAITDLEGADDYVAQIEPLI